MITIKCGNCGDKFGVDEERIRKGIVALEFKCPYCGMKFPVGFIPRTVGVTGGVNINGGNVSISGDIVGRDKKV